MSANVTTYTVTNQASGAIKSESDGRPLLKTFFWPAVHAVQIETSHRSARSLLTALCRVEEEIQDLLS